MSQSIQELDASVPDGDTGVDLANKYNALLAALLSGLSGSARPAAAVAGTIWRDTSTTPWAVKMFDGTDDIVLFQVDPTNNVPIFSGTSPWAVAGGTADAITATYTPAVTALVDGMIVGVRAGSANATTTPTFAPNALTPHTIVKEANTALATGDIKGSGHDLLLRYNASLTKWLLLNPAIPVVSTPDGSITNAKLADMVQALIKGRAAGAGNGDPQDLTASQVLAIIGLGSAASDIAALQSGKAPLASPALTGTPTAPTFGTTENSTRIATTAFVQALVALISVPDVNIAVARYATPGASTQNLSAAREIWFGVAIGGGGGGGGGNGASKAGGDGGDGEVRFFAAVVTSSKTVTVGSGGSGGSGVSGNNGGNGGDGTSSSVSGSIATADHGDGGHGATASADGSAGANGSGGTGAQWPFASTAGVGGGGGSGHGSGSPGDDGHGGADGQVIIVRIWLS